MASANPPVDTTSSFCNPERCWYFSAAGMFDTPSSFDSNCAILANGTNALQGGEPILLLHAYSQLPTSGAVSAGSLANWDANVLSLRSRGVKAIVRLYYGNAASDPVLATILSQLTQLKSKFYAARDVIYLVQVGLVGSYGEQANSANGNNTPTNKAAIMNAVLDMVPPEIPCAMRHPYFVMAQWGTPKSRTNSFAGSRQQRMGNHGDCYLTGQQDSSTYPGPATVDGLVITTSSAQQRQYHATDSDYVPNGGETCNNSQGAIQGGMRTGCTDTADGSGLAPNSGAGGIMNEGPRYHLAYLNRAYAPNFVGSGSPTSGSWNDGGCLTSIYRLMGYRLQLDSITHPDTVARGATLVITVKLRNLGWARLYSMRQLAARGTKSGATDLTGRSAQQLRSLPSQATSSTSFQIKIDVPANATPGVYNTFIEGPDIYAATTSLKNKIRFANTGWDAANARHSVGTSFTVT